MRPISPEMLPDFREIDTSCSSENRLVDTELKSAERDNELRFNDSTRELLLQRTPENEHGWVPFCQFWRILGFGRDDLKLNKFWVSLAFANGVETE